MEPLNNSIYFTIGFIHLLALISPGPDLILVTRNSMNYSRSIGVYTALGLGLGIFFHLGYTFIGIGLMINYNQWLFSTIKVLGGLYLVFLGSKALLDTFRKNTDEIENTPHNPPFLAPLKALKMGFLTNILNPKVGIYFISILSQFLSKETTLISKAILGSEVILLTIGYFCLIALSVSHPIVKKVYFKLNHILERTFGGILIALGLKVVLG